MPSRLDVAEGLHPAPAPPPSQPVKLAWSVVQAGLTLYDAPWTDEKTVRFADYFKKAQKQGMTTHASRIVKENRRAPLSWRKGVHYDQAATKVMGRVKQGGAKQPFMVTLRALKAYHAGL